MKKVTRWPQDPMGRWAKGYWNEKSRSITFWWSVYGNFHTYSTPTEMYNYKMREKRKRAMKRLRSPQPKIYLKG